MTNEEQKFKLETPKSIYPLLSTKIMRSGDKRLFKVIKSESFKEKDGKIKGAYILECSDTSEIYKYVPNKTAQGNIIKFAKLDEEADFDSIIDRTITIEVIDTQYMGRPTLGLMVVAVK